MFDPYVIASKILQQAEFLPLTDEGLGYLLENIAECVSTGGEMFVKLFGPTTFTNHFSSSSIFPRRCYTGEDGIHLSVTVSDSLSDPGGAGLLLCDVGLTFQRVSSDTELIELLNIYQTRSAPDSENVISCAMMGVRRSPPPSIRLTPPSFPRLSARRVLFDRSSNYLQDRSARRSRHSR